MDADGSIAMNPGEPCWLTQLDVLSRRVAQFI